MPRNDYICGISGRHFRDEGAYTDCKKAHECHNCPFVVTVQGSKEPLWFKRLIEKIMEFLARQRKEIKNKASPTLHEPGTYRTSTTSYLIISGAFVLLAAGVIWGVVVGIRILIVHWPFK